MTTTTPGLIELSVTLADGTRYACTVKRMPQHWRSYVMQELPYDADFRGAVWSRRRIGAAQSN